VKSTVTLKLDRAVHSLTTYHFTQQRGGPPYIDTLSFLPLPLLLLLVAAPSASRQHYSRDVRYR